MKIGILTITHGANFGNKLQNYALQQVLRSLGHKVETIHDVRWRKNNLSFSFNLKLFLKCFLKIKFNILHLKQLRFNIWSKKHIKWSPYVVSDNTRIRSELCSYDKIVCGSDQIWHPQLCFSDYSFMTFADKQKRVAYAPSFGVSRIPEGKKEQYKTWLSGIDKLSVREEAGAKIIKELTGKEAPVVLDPTMLLSAKDYEKITKKPKNVIEPFLLLYFLGEITDEYSDYIHSVAEKYSLKIIDITRDQIFTHINPSEFIYLFKHANYVFTDSFHAAVFSIIFHRNFTVMNRVQENVEDMSSRLDTLLNKFNLQDRYYSNNKYSYTNEIDWENVDVILEKEKKNSLGVLKNLLN